MNPVDANDPALQAIVSIPKRSCAVGSLVLVALVGVVVARSHSRSTTRTSGARQTSIANETGDGDAVHLPGVPPRLPETLINQNRYGTARSLGMFAAPISNNGGSGYAGIDFTHSGGYVPPDTCGAVGPGAYIETTNQEVAIYTPKASGSTAVMDSLQDFFFTRGGLPHASGGSGLSDPIVTYDELIGRYIVGDQDVDFNAHVSNFLVAVSKSSNPSTLTTSDWTFYYINTTEPGYDADYPGNFGYNGDAWVFTLNMFSVAGTGNHVQVESVSAADLAAGVSESSLHAYKNDLSDFAVRPTTMHGSVSGDPMWFVSEHGDNASIDVIRMTSVLSNSATFSYYNVPVNSYSKVVPPVNPNGSQITTNIDSRILKAAESNNKLVATHAIAVSSTEDAARWYLIDLSSGTPTLSDQGQVSAGNNTYQTYPAIDINSNGFIGLTFMRSGTDTGTDYMSMYVTGRGSSDASGTMQTPTLVPAGTGQANYSDFSGSGRAGDLSGINVDPADGSFWAASEYATTTAGNQSSGNWGTAIANFTVPSIVPSAAVSRKTHGSVGTFDINLPLTGKAGVECRSGGSNGDYSVVVTFPNAVVVGSTSVTSSDNQATADPAQTSGDFVTVNIHHVSNAQTVSVNLNNVSDGTHTAGVSVPMSVLIGDTTGDGLVNSADVSQTKGRSGQTLSQATNNFRSDVTTDGTINSADISLVKSKSGTALH